LLSSTLLGVIAFTETCTYISETAYNTAVMVGMLTFGYQTIYMHWNYRSVMAAESISTGLMNGARSNNLQLFLFCVFLNYVHVVLGVIVLGMYSVFQAMTSAQKTSMADASTMKQQFQEMQKKMAVAMKLAALTEVSILFLLLINFRLIYVLVYVNWLRQRLSCNDDIVFRVRFTSGTVAGNHYHAWRTLGALIEPLLKKVPFMRAPLGVIQTWFVPKAYTRRAAPAAPAPAPAPAPAKVPSWNIPKMGEGEAKKE
jgi:hypothetical protein